MIRYLIILSSFFIWFNSFAQTSRLIFDHYGYAEGYLSLAARNITKTKDGLIWITGNEGLGRYDSKSFLFYKHDQNDTASIAGNTTYHIAADRRGHIWVQAGSGLDVFDPTTEQFKHSYLVINNNIIKDFWVKSLLYDSTQDRVWIGTELGLYYSQNGSLKLQKAVADTKSENFLNMLFGTITMDYEKNLWLGNADGYYKYNTLSGTIKHFHIPNQDPLIFNDDAVFSLYFDKKGILWIGTWTKGLVSFDPKTEQYATYYYSDHTKENNSIISIAQTHLPWQKDLLWISAINRGLGTFNTVTKKFDFYSSASSKDIFGINSMTNGFYPDAYDGMWIGAEEGLHKLDYSRQLFSKTDLTTYNPFFSKTEPIDNFYFEKNKHGSREIAWITIPYLGAYTYDFSVNQLKKAPALLDKYLHNMQCTIFSIFIDSRNVLWISTNPFGLIGYSIDNRTFVTNEYSYFFKEREWVSNFYEDRKGNLWLGTYGGLYMLETDRKNLLPAKNVNILLQKDGLPQHITGITEDAKGRIWFVAGEKEYKSVFGYYNPISQTARVFKPKEDRNLPQAEEMFSITFHSNTLYISSSDGLITADIGTDNFSFTQLTVNNGLMQNLVRNLLVDADGYIWCSGLFGISCYKPGEKSFINFPKESYGLETTSSSKLIQSPVSKNICITQKGSFTTLDPDAIITLPPPRIIFNSLSVFDKQLFGYSQLLNRDSIRLRHNQNTVAVDFAALSYSNSSQNVYSWKLEGLEEDWHQSYTSSATYNKLSPGKYTLLVRAANSGGVWSAEPVSLTFFIRPPFWKTWWFITLCFITVAAVIFYIARLKIKSIKEKFSLRNKIAADLHDEIGSTLTSISILSTVSQQAMEQQPQQAKEMLQKISSQSRSIQQNMSDIVWSIRPDNEKIENLIARMREYAAQTLEPLDIKIMIDADESLINKSLPMECRKELLLIYKEAINNIAKYAGATLVQVSFASSHHQLQLSIADNGKWKGNSSGTGTKSMKDRAHTLGGNLAISIQETGTVVSVFIPVP